MDQLPPDATALAKRMASLEKEVKELRAARRMTTATVGRLRIYSDDEQRDVADDLNIDGGNSAREAVVENPHQRADEAERKAQGEASALISTERKAPQPSAGK